MDLVILPGIGGSDAHHWQTRWELDSPEFRRFSPTSWDDPDHADWSAALDRAVTRESTVLVAHSLACLLAVRWSVAHPSRVAGLFLVAAPDPDGERFPTEAASFGWGLDVRFAVPSVLVASEDDPYCTARRSAELADVWGALHVSVGRRGHLNSASALGSWTEGRNLLTAFIAGLGDTRQII